MDVPNKPLRLTRVQAAVRQIDAAIVAFEAGDFDVAFTLAGAAEGMFSHRKSGTLFEGLRDAPEAREKFPNKKEWINTLNLERDWLKHDGDKPDNIEIDTMSTAYMIARACSKMTASEWSTKMEDFRIWILEAIKPSNREHWRQTKKSPP